MPSARDELGRRGEDEAVRYLRGLGYRIVGRRERVLRGDIDVVAVTFPGPGALPTARPAVEHYQNAFDSPW